MGIAEILSAIGAIIAAIGAAWALGRKRGKDVERQGAITKDRANADKIRDAADRARRADDAGNIDAVERLSKRGRLRD